MKLHHNQQRKHQIMWELNKSHTSAVRVAGTTPKNGRNNLQHEKKKTLSVFEQWNFTSSR